MENYIVINGKKAELTPEQLKALGIEMGNPFERCDGQKYWYIDPDFTTVNYGNDTYSCLDHYRYQVANYCTDKEMMQQQAWKEELSRLLWRYSMGHDGDKIDFNRGTKFCKWMICIYQPGSAKNCELYTDFTFCSPSIGSVYFFSKEIALQAIEEIVKSFLSEHPDFVL